MYEYRCECGVVTDVIKSARDFERPENCPTCAKVMRRAFAPRRIHLYGTEVQEKQFQPALGRPATRREMQAEAKKQGWIEVGNERPESFLKPQVSEYPSFTNDEIAQLTRKP